MSTMRFTHTYTRRMDEPLQGNPDNSMALRNEILGLCNQVLDEVAEAIPEYNYPYLSLVTVIIPQILLNLSYALPQSENDIINATWNNLDAAAQGITGLQQLFDRTSHRPAVTKAKGVINIASSLQLFILTGISVTSLGPISFAIGAAACFSLSLDESIRQMRRLFSPEYFFVDTVTQLDKVEELIAEKEASLAKLNALSPADRNSKSGRLAIGLVNSALESLTARRLMLRQHLETKLDIELFESERTPSSLKEPPLKGIVTRYKDNKKLIKSDKCRGFLATLDKRPPPSPSVYVRKKLENTLIQKQIKSALMGALFESAMWGLAFTGILLLCIPGCQAQGAACILAASILFLLKNSKKIVAKARQIYGFFHKYVPEKEKTAQIQSSQARRSAENEIKKPESPRSFRPNGNDGQY